MMEDYDDDEVYEGTKTDTSVDLDEDDADEVKMDDFDYDDSEEDDIFSDAAED